MAQGKAWVLYLKPDEIWIYERFKELAQKNDRPISRMTVIMLRELLEERGLAPGSETQEGTVKAKEGGQPDDAQL